MSNRRNEISYSDDDDDEEEPQSKTEEGADGEAPEVQRRKKRPSSHELHMYTADELAVFKKRELIADEQLLDGRSYLSYSMMLY